jgi:hypothetical protein
MRKPIERGTFCLDSQSQIFRRTITKVVQHHKYVRILEHIQNHYSEWQEQVFFSLHQVFYRDAIMKERSHPLEADNLKSILTQKDEVTAELLTEHIALKKDLDGKLKEQWISVCVRDQIVDFINHWKHRNILRHNCFCRTFGLNQENCP